MFYDKLTKLCDNSDIKKTTLLKILNLSSSGLERWKRGVVPNGETLIKIADYFNVSVDYLLDRNTNNLENDLDIISLYQARQNMTQQDKEKMMAMLKLTFEYAFNDKTKDNNINSTDI